MPRLFVLSGDDVGHTHDFDTALVLGRAKDADMRIRGASISRKHARVEPDADGWKITDLGSANGVFVGGKRVKSGRLEDGDEFRLGDVELRLRTTLPAVVLPRPGPAALPFEESSAQTQMVPGAAPPPPPPPPPREPAPEEPPPAPSADGGFELEGDWSDEPAVPLRAPSAAPAPAAAKPPTPAPPRPAATVQRSAADAAGRRAAALGTPAASVGARTTTSGKRILQYNKVVDPGGIGGSELAQQPTLVRWALYLLAAAVFAGLVWGAFELTRGLRGKRSPPVEAEF